MAEEIGIVAVVKDEQFQAGMTRLVSSINNLTGEVEKSATRQSSLWESVSSHFTITAGDIVNAAKAIAGAVEDIATRGLRTTMAWGENMDKLGDMFGMTGEQASMWTVAMEHVGLTVDEGAMGLNYFTRNLDNVKTSLTASGGATKDNSDKIRNLTQQLNDANLELVHAKERMADAKTPTDSMRWSVDAAATKVARLSEELRNTPYEQTAAKLTPFQEALNKLGVSAFDVHGKLKTFDQIMPEIMDKFQKLPAGIDASALAMDMFGARGGSKFLDFLRQGSTGLQNATKFAEEFGLTLTTDTVNSVEEFGFTLNDLKMAITGVWNQLGVAMLPSIRELVTAINKDVLPALSIWLKQNMPALQQAFRDISRAILTDVLPAVKSAISWFIENWPAIQKGISDTWSVVKPMLAAFASAIGLLVEAFKIAAPIFKEIGSRIVFGICDGIRDAAWSLVYTLHDIIQNAVNAVKAQLGIRSPSAVFADIGAQMAAGLVLGFGAPLAGLPLGDIAAARVLPGGYGGGSFSSSNTVNNYFNLTTNSTASAASLSADFGIMRSLSSI